MAILAAAALTLASVATNDAIHLQSNQAQTSGTASTRAQSNKAYILYSGLWRTDGGFVSTIRIKNVLVVAPMDVVPVLFMADGTPYMLSSVHVAVSGVATININDALAAAPDSVRGHISQYGSAALIWRYSSPGHVTAQLAAIDAFRSLSFVFPFSEPMGEPMQQTVEGLWWKRDPGVVGFVALSNAMDADTQATVQLVGPGNSAQAERTIALPAHSTRMLNLEDLADNPSPLAKRVGGIRVQYTGRPGSVQITGGLENDSGGYSANIPFWGHDMSSASPGQKTYASAGIMVGEPDPMMMPGFPKDTTFIPYLTLRNTSEKPLDVTLQLNYMMGMEGSAPVTRNLPAQHLGPFEARQVDMHAALNSAGLKSFNGTINLSASFSGKAGDLVLATGSVDQTGSYVFEVEPESVESFRSKNANYWGVAKGNDTMFSLWNPTSAAQDMLVTFYYADGSGKYDLPVHLGPQASTMIDMAMLIAENKPDPEGNVIPSNIQEGSAEFASAKGRNEKITLVIAAGIYNVSTATCGGGCIQCCGDSNFGFSPNPINVPIGQSVQCTSTGVDCHGYTVLPYFWSSSNTAVMTVNGSGNVTGVSAGSATITADFGSVIVYTGQLCSGGSCPSAPVAPSAPGNVTPRITSISPPAKGPIGATTPVTLNGQGFGTSPSVDAGSGITVTINSKSDTQIQASFAISSSASGGNRSVTVTVAGQTSNSVNFFVQVPTSLSIVSGTNSTTPEASCSAGSFGTGCGVTRSFFYQVNDQEIPPQPIQTPGLQVWDAINTTSPNNLGITGYVTTCTGTPAGTNNGPCNVTTNSLGQFGENNPGLSVCSTVCRVNNMCTTGGPTNANQSVHVGPSVIVQNISYYCDRITINGQ